MADQIKSFISNLIASAIWDLLKRVLGSALVLALVTAIWEKTKHGTLDWPAIGGIFLLTVLVVGSIFLQKLKQVVVTDNTKPPEGDDTNWKQLYLEANQRSSKLANDYAEAENKAILLQRRVDELSKPDTSLLARTTLALRNTWGFLRSIEPPPELEPGQLGTPAGQKFIESMGRRVNKIHAGFSLRLHPEIERVTLELSEIELFDYSLNKLMQNQAHSEDNIREIGNKLLCLRDRLELREYGETHEAS